jgi:hypothetical protein
MSQRDNLTKHSQLKWNRTITLHPRISKYLIFTVTAKTAVTTAATTPAVSPNIVSMTSDLLVPPETQKLTNTEAVKKPPSLG